MCGGVHVDTVAEDGLVVAVEGGLADVQAMAVPHAGLGLSLFGAVVKGELDADLPLVSGRRVLAVGDRPTERVGVRHDAGALARPIGVNQNELRLAVFPGRLANGFAEAHFLADALQKGHALRVVVGKEAHGAGLLQLGDFGLAANGARDEIAVALGASGRGVLAAIKDDLQVQLVPLVLREEALGVALGLLHILAVGEIPAVHQPVDVGVHRKGRDAKGLRHDHRRGLVAHARQPLQRLHVLGDNAAVLVHQDLAQTHDGLGLLRAESTRADDGPHLLYGDVPHVLGVVRPGKQGRGDLVDPLVRALGAEQHGHQQRVGVGVVQRNRHFRVQTLEFVHHPLDTRRLCRQIGEGKGRNDGGVRHGCKVSSQQMNATQTVHSMVDAADLAAFRKHLEGANTVAITSHRSPDADAVGTSLALARYLKSSGKDVTCLLPDAPDEALDWMEGVEDIVLFDRDPGKAQDILHRADVLFALDYNGMGRLGPMADAARSATGTWLMVDHHMGPEDFPAAQVHDARCSSTAELLWGVIAGLGGKDAVEPVMASLLYAGMMTDTGSFRFASVSAETHRVIAEMMDRGLQHTPVHEAIFGEQPMDRMKLHAFAVVERMEVHPEFQTAFIHLTAEDMARFNYRAGYTEGLVNKALGVAGVKVAVFAKQSTDRVKMSFRSVGQYSVRDLAEQHFDGGGHNNAAGGASTESIGVVMARLRGLLPEIAAGLAAAEEGT